jgi:hypothetical protein
MMVAYTEETAVRAYELGDTLWPELAIDKPWGSGRTRAGNKRLPCQQSIGASTKNRTGTPSRKMTSFQPRNRTEPNDRGSYQLAPLAHSRLRFNISDVMTAVPMNTPANMLHPLP